MLDTRASAVGRVSMDDVKSRTIERNGTVRLLGAATVVVQFARFFIRWTDEFRGVPGTVFRQVKTIVNLVVANPCIIATTL